MTGLLAPQGIWRWYETVTVVAVVAMVLLTSAAIDPRLTDLDGMAGLAGLADRSAVIANVAALCASILLYIHWRLASGVPLAWLVLGLSAISVHALAMSGLVAQNSALVEGRPGLTLLTQVLLTAGVLLVVYLAQRRFQPDPLALGFAIGSGLFALCFAALVGVPHLALSEVALGRLAALALLLSLTIAVAVAAFPRAARWVRYRVALSLALLGVAHAATYPAPESAPGALLAVPLNVLGGSLLLCLAIALVRRSMRDNRAAMMLLRDQLQRVEEVVRTDEAQLHEIRATVAGISNAAHVVSTYDGIAPVRRDRIRAMIDAEIGRLARLTQSTGPGPVGAVDLDRTLEPVVVRLLTEGHPVSWCPSGDVVRARADDVAEIVNVLLENAVHHGLGAPVRLGTRRRDGVVEIAVSDAGPGVPHHLRDRIFEWGQSRPGSPGSGIGLAIARDLSVKNGGDLKLTESEAPGATFVLSLPSGGGTR